MKLNEERDPVRPQDFSRFILKSESLHKILRTNQSPLDIDSRTKNELPNVHFCLKKTIKINAHKKGGQHRFSPNVWMGIIDDNLISLFFFHITEMQIGTTNF